MTLLGDSTLKKDNLIDFPAASSSLEKDADPESSRLLQIPLELRRLIYQFILHGDGDRIHIKRGPGRRLRGLQCKMPDQCSLYDPCPDSRNANCNNLNDFLDAAQSALSLRRNCRQIHYELSVNECKLAVASRVFVFDKRRTIVESSKTWRFQCIRRLELDMIFDIDCFYDTGPLKIKPTRSLYFNTWMRAWEVVAGMSGLEKLEAFIHHDSELRNQFEPRITEEEEEVLRPLHMVTAPKVFEVKMNWKSQNTFAPRLKIPNCKISWGISCQRAKVCN